MSTRSNIEIVTRPHVDNFINWSADKPEVLVLSADLTNSCEVGKWRDTYPDRFFSMGMAEQNMISFAAGLAREGFEPWLHTFAVFLYRRPLDQLQMSVAYPNLKVRLVGFLPGITTPGGVTHQAIDDVAVMRAIPNMTIVETGDATEVESVVEVAHAVDGPVYRARVLSLGGDTLDAPAELVVLTSGILTEEALRAIPALRAAGVSVSHLHVSTLKPFTDPTIVTALRSATAGVITMENHLTTGGLGSAVAEVMAENSIATPLHRMGLRDTYAHGASQPYLLAEYHLDALSLVRVAENVLDRHLGVSASDLTEVRVAATHSNAKVEAL